MREATGKKLLNRIPNHEDAGCGQQSKEIVQRSVCRVRNWRENYRNLYTKYFSYFYHNPLFLIQKSKERKEFCRAPRENTRWSKSGEGAGRRALKPTTRQCEFQKAAQEPKYWHLTGRSTSRKVGEQIKMLWSRRAVAYTQGTVIQKREPWIWRALWSRKAVVTIKAAVKTQV